MQTLIRAIALLARRSETRWHASVTNGSITREGSGATRAEAVAVAATGMPDRDQFVRAASLAEGGCHPSIPLVSHLPGGVERIGFVADDGRHAQIVVHRSRM